MITINAAFGQEEKVLGTLGRIGENETRQIVFDCSDILTEYPGAEIVCVMQRHCDRIAYLADAVLAGNVLTVTLTDADVSASGDLRIELRALTDGKIRKSAVYMGQVVSALRGAQDRPGNPIADVLNRIDMTISRAEESIAEADAAAKSAQTVADIVQAKLDNGDFVGPAGKDGANGKDGAPGKDGKDGEKGPKGDTGATGPQGAPGSDASVTADNIRAALGYTPVKDVQVGGTSVLTEGVANVPIAGNKVPGVMGVDNYSMGIAANNNVFLFGSRKGDIDTRAGNIAIDPIHIDYAVKAAMCDGKGAAWTDAEQQAARERMGVGKAYELIEEIVLNESVTQVARTNISLAEMRIVIEVPVSDSTGAIVLEVYSGSSMIGYGYIGNFINKGNIKIAKFTVKRDRGTYAFSYVTVNANSAAQRAGAGTLSESASLYPVENAITKISLYSTSNAIPLPIGTKIKIEGETI